MNFIQRCIRDINLIPEAIKKGFEYRNKLEDDEFER